jgi:hypothetical protein
MCEFCNYDSVCNEIYQDPLDGRYYLDIQTFEWDSYDNDYVHQRLYINYCPYCGRRLDAKNNIVALGNGSNSPSK